MSWYPKLIAGLFGYDVIKVHKLPYLEIRYWDKVEEALKKLGCLVYTGRVGTVSSLRIRAQQLHQLLSEKLNGQSVNLIAHSMVQPVNFRAA